MVRVDYGGDVEEFVEIGGNGDLIGCCCGGEENELLLRAIGQVFTEVEESDGDGEERGGFDEWIGGGGWFHGGSMGSKNGGVNMN